jgi:hypothetical protein
MSLLSDQLNKLFGPSWPTTLAGVSAGTWIAVEPIVMNAVNHVAAGDVVDWSKVGEGILVAAIGYLAKYHKASNAPAPLPVAQTVPDAPAKPIAVPNSVVVGEATVFGLNYDGSPDPGDNGVGAWGAKTNNTDIVGVSLPEGVMISTFGFSGTWAENHSKVGEYLAKNKTQVSVTKDGKTVLADVVDAGPAGRTHNALDLTYNLAHQLNTDGKAIVSYSIMNGSVPMEIKGWDFVNGMEIKQPGVA